MGRPRAFLLALALLAAAPAPALADGAAPPPSTPPAAASAPAAAPATATAAPPATAPPTPPTPAAAQGAIIIAIDDAAVPAARALARDTYASERLRPRIDDATARVLAGETPAATAPPRLTEIADVRRGVQTAGDGAVARRLLTSLGADLGALLVVPVAVRDGKPYARVLSVAKGAFEPLELTASAETQPDGATRIKWAGVTGLLEAFVPAKTPPTAPTAPTAAPKPAASPSAPGPLAPKKDEPPRSFWSSPWTWVGIGVVTAAGVIVLVATQTQGDPGMLKLQGRVSQ